MRSGLVLAGGRSRRFGSEDKALVPIDGTPMIRRVATRLAQVVDELVVNCRDEQVEAIRAALEAADSPLEVPTRYAADPVPDEGPVAGMRTGLRVARGETVAVLACDVPKADPDLLERLATHLEADDRSTDAPASFTAAVPSHEGRRQPLHAVYDRAAARCACEQTLATGSRRLLDALDRLSVSTVPIDPDSRAATALANVNRPDDLPTSGSTVR